MNKYETELTVATFDENGMAQSTGWVQVYYADPVTQEYMKTMMERVQKGNYISIASYTDAPVLPESSDVGIYRAADGQSWEYRPDGRGTRQYQIELSMAKFKNGFAEVSGWTKVYSAHYDTLEYMGVGMSLMQKGGGLPAQAFLDKPVLPTDSDTAICRSPDRQSWISLSDFRGKTAYNILSGYPMVITKLGELPSALTWLKPKTPFDKWDGHQWVTDVEKQRKENEHQRQNFLNEARQQMAKLEQEKRLKLLEWDLYGVKLMELDISSSNIDWPKKPA
ncbi:tail fiber assembly protein [Xenorhabdus bovienii]|uniref:tail fiber assembly protein n=1 Tax=Xenorhabdus bovienii TaxID=40576 RepID=UPI0023B2FCD2|nr:tail fiber assembly protein [Xenorhabdus bovienii]MDE9543878.1 tail fiber assembly protein [Xenorhabdus bovienii]